MYRALRSHASYLLLIFFLGISGGITTSAMGNSWQQGTIAQLESELASARESGDQTQIAQVLFRLGTAYVQNGRPNDGITAFEESIGIHESVGNTRGIALTSSSIGMAYNDLNQYSKAIEYLNKAIQGFQSMGNKRALAGEYLNLANVRRYSGAYAESNSAADLGLELARELQSKNLLTNFFLIKSENYRDLGQTEQSIEALGNYQMLKNDIDQQQIQQSEQKAQQVQSQLNQSEQARQETLEQLDSTSQELSAAQQLAKLQEERINMLDENQRLQEEASQALKEQIASEKWANRLLYIGISMALIFLLVVLRGLMINRRKNAILATQNNEIHQQKIELMVQRDKIRSKSRQLEEALTNIKEANTKITSSINYAKRIQEAMLPTRESVRRRFPDSFILFKPRDIVSGDFYWFADLQTLPTEQSDHTIITAVDCTGHGVPGAFMSMIGAELLNKIVLMQGITQPGEILSEVHQEIRKALKQETTENRDGMDMALCCVHPDGKTMEYAGAQNPLVYIQNGEIHQIKATRYSVGGIQKEPDRVYENHTLTFDQPTAVYIFSDGYQDQFGGDSGRKFMIKRMKELLLEIHQKPMSEQHDILDQAIEKWRGEFRQVDDILVMGFRIG